MAELQMDEQGTPATPASGKMLVYPDSSASVFVQKNDAGRVQGDDSRVVVAAQTLGVADTYVTNSGLIVPSSSVQVGTAFEWKIYMTKTAAGVAAPVYQIRIGANQTTADTSRLSATGPAQTAVADAAELQIVVSVRSVGVAGVIQGSFMLAHNLAATGFAATGPAGTAFLDATSAGFDNTALGGQFVGLSINAGAASAWTITQCIGRVWY